MSTPSPGDVVHKYSCRCLNITITTCKPTSEPPRRLESNYESAFVGEDGIHITHHCLTLRTRNRAQKLTKSPNKLIQHLALFCLACKTLAYRVAQEVTPDSEAREGPVVPTEDWVEQETLRSKSGWIEVFVGSGGCLVGKAIEQHLRSIKLSRTFSVGILSPSTSPRPSVATSPTLATFAPPSLDIINSSLPERILPSLPPLFPPPPFTPSHPVFVTLSVRATEKSTDLRLRAEEETRSFVQSQLDMLEREEAQLREEVEGIWRGYREGWKEVLGKVNEERRRSVAVKSEGPIQTSSVKSGVPMSIRDFSPIVRSHPQHGHPHTPMSPTVRPPSPSLLSASLYQTGAHLPPAAAQSPGLNMSIPERPTPSSISHDHNASASRSPHANGAGLSGSSSISIKAGSDSSMPGAFRRNMDTDMDIASSLAWAKGEEEMRRRLGGEDSEPGERARKRTSKNLGIGAVEKSPNVSAAPTTRESVRPASVDRSTGKGGAPRQSDRKTVEKPDPDSEANSQRRSLDGTAPSSRTDTSETNGASTKSKRRVTFDVQPDAATIPQARVRHPAKHVDEVELFDLDDLTSTQPFLKTDLHAPPKPVRPQPVTRTPSYKLRANEAASSSRQFQPASLPAPRAVPPRSPVNGNIKWPGGPARRSVGLADALPLLSSSVPAGDRVLIERSIDAANTRLRSPRTPSPLAEQTPSRSQAHVASPTDDRTPSPAPPTMSHEAEEPAEAELKNLLAASAPSHRHAWREGGRAWEMFHQRSRDKKKVKGAIVEEDGDGMYEIPGGSSENSSDEDEDDTTRDSWRNPSQFAISLPVQIRPLVEYKPTLQPKTSLADKQGVLVPPLKVQSGSAASYRKAMYAERDRTRSIDPGPTLDFNEQEDIEEEDMQGELDDGDRGRRHALSILQARSVIPEAGMWRSMAS